MTIVGAARHEDTLSIQILDRDEKLHLLLKKDLAEVKHTHKSLMPAAAVTGADLDHVLALETRYDPSSIPLPEWHPAADFNVTFARLKNATAEPRNWLTYWGNYSGKQASALKAITPGNVRLGQMERCLGKRPSREGGRKRTE